MKTTNFITSRVSIFFLVVSAQAQGTFQNLNFEQANPVSANDPDAPYFVTASSALPNWGVFYSGVQQSDISYNGISTGATQVTLLSTGNSSYNAIDGSYSVLLQGIVPGSTASISQTGLIPSGTQSLLFEAQPGIGPLDVYVGTQIVPFTAVGTGPNYTLYGGNIAAFAEDTEELTFSAFGGSYNNWEIDDISFSPTAATPEPSIVALMLMGGLAFGVNRWRGSGTWNGIK
jgi:hypothetical protein